MNHSGRLRGLQQTFAKNKLDGLLVTHLPNIRYLCGFTGSAGVLAVTARKVAFFTDGRYTSQARSEVKGARVLISSTPALTSAAEWLGAETKKRNGRASLGIEGTHLTVADRGRVADVLPARVRFREAPALIERARMVKDDDEIEILREAVLLGASLFDVAVKTIRPGVKEVEVAAEMEFAARKAGAEAMSFQTIIASGERSALPHGVASEAKIAARGFVVCDFGVILAGYCSDMTRTVMWVSPGREAIASLYEAVREAQQAAVEAVGAGVSRWRS